MYTREVFASVKEELERRRTAAESAAEERRLSLYQKSARIKEIDDELSGTGILIFKAAVAGRGIDKIKARNESLMGERCKLLATLGLPDGYTDPDYSCCICSDTGYREDGFMCDCMRELIKCESIKASGIGKLIDKQSFDNFDLSWYEGDASGANMHENFAKLKSFADGFCQGLGKTFFMIGTTGTGKTHLSTAVAKTLIEKGYSVCYDSIQNIISDFEADKFKSGYGAYQPKSDKYLSADLLIIDDLGTELVTTQFSLACIYNIINTRQNKGMSTIVSTNLKAREFSSKYEARITSRLMGEDADVLLFGGPDHRIG